MSYHDLPMPTQKLCVTDRSPSKGGHQTQCAHTAVQYDDRMKRYYKKMTKEHNHNIAITHVANKMINDNLTHTDQQNPVRRANQQTLSEKA